MNDDLKKFGFIIMGGMGTLILLAGIYLGFNVFEDARDLLKNPAPLEKWIDLRNKIHPTDTANIEEKSKPVAPPKKQEGFTIEDSAIRSLGGYLTLFLSLMYIYLLSKIALAFVQSGSALLLQAKSFFDKK